MLAETADMRGGLERCVILNPIEHVHLGILFTSSGMQHVVEEQYMMFAAKGILAGVRIIQVNRSNFGSRTDLLKTLRAISLSLALQ